MRIPCPRAQDGIVLVTTLLMTVLIVMFITAVVYLGAGGLAMSGNFYEREAALMAADSGVQYAMARLQQSASWRGDQPATAPAPQPDFAVVEEAGNVLGFLSTRLGHKSQFRLKFNCEDGDGGEDGLSDSAAGSRYSLAMPYISVNNLLGLSPRGVFRAGDDGRVRASTEPSYLVPRRTACLLVQGLAGWGLRDADPSSPGEFLADRAVVSRLVEAYLAIDESAGLDSAAYAAGDIEADLGSAGVFQLSSADSDQAPKMRSLQSVNVSGFNARFAGGANAEVVVGDAGAFRVNGLAPRGVKVTHADSSDQFKRLSWDGIAKASPSAATDAQVRGGTYVWRQGDNKKAYLEYFDVDLEEGEALPAAGTGTVVTSSSVTTTEGQGVSVDPGSLTLEIERNVYVAASEGGSQGFAILTDPALTAEGSRPSVLFSLADGASKAPILTSEGSVRIEGSATGMGSVTSGGSLTFQGPSVLEADPDTGVSLYAKEDILVEATPGAVAHKGNRVTEILGDYFDQGGDPLSLYRAVTGAGGSSGIDPELGRALDRLGDKQRQQLKKQWLKAVGNARPQARIAFLQRLADNIQGSRSGEDQSLTGMIFTWKDFRTRINGRLYLRGAVVAYGGNPDDAVDNSPGTNEGGNIRLRATSVNLTYDPTYIRDLVGNTDTLKVRRTLWATY